jgi:hypothetical protein
VVLFKENLIKSLKDSLSKKKRLEGFSVTKWKLFKRLKSKEGLPTESGLPTEQYEEPEKRPTIPKTREESKEVPIKEYNETLYSKGSAQKQPESSRPEKKQNSKRTSWESPETIEQSIDSMERKETGSTGNITRIENNTEKKVDFILLKKKGRS